MNPHRYTTLAGILVLLVVSALSAGLARWRSAAPLPLVRVSLATKVSEAGLGVVDLVTAAEQAAAGTHVFVDARPLEEYEAGRILFALSLPETSFEEVFPEFSVMVPLETPLVVYCSGPECDAAFQVARLLKESGYTEVAVLLEGFTAWQAGGYDVE